MIQGDDRSWPEQEENITLTRNFPCPVCPSGFATSVPTRAGLCRHLQLRHKREKRVLSPSNETLFAVSWCDGCESYYKKSLSECPDCNK
jgi:hypothetical protein